MAAPAAHSRSRPSRPGVIMDGIEGGPDDQGRSAAALSLGTPRPRLCSLSSCPSKPRSFQKLPPLPRAVPSCRLPWSSVSVTSLVLVTSPWTLRATGSERPSQMQAAPVCSARWFVRRTFIEHLLFAGHCECDGPRKVPLLTGHPVGTQSEEETVQLDIQEPSGRSGPAEVRLGGCQGNSRQRDAG